MNRRIRMMKKALPCFKADKYLTTHDVTQIPLGVFARWLRKGRKNASLQRV